MTFCAIFLFKLMGWGYDYDYLPLPLKYNWDLHSSVIGFVVTIALSPIGGYLGKKIQDVQIAKMQSVSISSSYGPSYLQLLICCSFDYLD